MNYTKMTKEQLISRIEELENELNKKNSRGAGRKSTLSPLELAAIKADYNSGMRKEELAFKYGKSMSTIQRLLKF